MRRVDPGKLARASALLGDTVLKPAGWPQVMEEISNSVGATGAALLHSDVRTPGIPRTTAVQGLLSCYFQNHWAFALADAGRNPGVHNG